MKNKRAAGAAYEETASAYLYADGYRILERNYRNRCGEIDIIAKKDSVLVFLEVKFRSSDSCGDPLEAVDARKQRRICRTALHYYTARGYYGKASCRFDVLGIYGDGTIRHVENAFAFVY